MSLAEWGVILIVGLIVFGPKRLPELAYQLGKVIVKLRAMQRHVWQMIENTDVKRSRE